MGYGRPHALTHSLSCTRSFSFTLSLYFVLHTRRNLPSLQELHCVLCTPQVLKNFPNNNNNYRICK